MNWKRWIWRLVILLGAAGIGYWLGHRAGGGSADEVGGEQKGPIAQVTLAPIERKSIADTVTGYGSVITQPGKSHVVSAAYETRVRHVLVAPGQPVTTGQALVEIDSSPQTQLQLAEARGAAQAAQKELEQTQQKFTLKLATNQELGAAKKAAESAQLQLQSLEKQGAAAPQQMKSEMDGLVGKVDVQGGQIVQAGSPLVELVAQNEIEVKLGVEPEDVVHVAPGQAVSLFQVQLPGAAPIVGRVRLITQRVDPETRLVDVYVTLPNDTVLFLDSYLRAELKTQAHDTLVVPRAAVLPEGDGHVVFTVREKRAVVHQVQIGIENAKEIEVIAPGLKAGEQVVVRGNYELSEGMAVATGKTP
jgi:membrane fusion protein (multidrug efflux system)